MKKILLITLSLLLTSFSAFAGELSDSDQQIARATMQKLIDNSLGELLSKDSDYDDRVELLEDLITDHMDVERVSSYVLGSTWKQAGKSQRAEFQKVFTDYQVYRFAQTFSDYNGENISIEGTEPASGNDQTFVVMNITPAGEGAEIIELKWRLRKDKKSSEFKIIDVIAAGISMALTYKNEYSSVVKTAEEQGKNGLDTLIELLRAKTEEMKKKSS